MSVFPKWFSFFVFILVAVAPWSVWIATDGNTHCFSQVRSNDSDKNESNSGKTGTLVICGGGSLPEEILQRFVELGDGRDGHLVVIPTASESADEPDQTTRIKRWKDRGFEQVSVLHTRNRERANNDDFVKPLDSATAIWFSGGAQSRLAEAYQGTATQEAIQQLFQRGGVVGGTSAGAAIQSNVMIESGNPRPKLSKGFDLMPNSIIDQHFLKRNRFNRLLHAVRKYPDRTGIGIDESTALVFSNGKCEVIGKSYVVVVSIDEKTKQASIATYHSGDSIDLSNDVSD